MIKDRGKSVCILFALFFLVLNSHAAAEVKIGQKLPSMVGRNLVGKTIDLESLYEKRPVVIAFWSMFCQPCVAEISSLITLQEKYRGQIEVIGINTDGEIPPARVRRFIERYEKFENKKINYEIIFDEKNKITRLLKVGFLPTVLAIDQEGKIINSFVGFEEKDEEAIFQGIEALLPLAGRPKASTEEIADVFEVEISLPICGFYNETGWVASFYGGEDYPKELERVSRAAKEQALKTALALALEKFGVKLYEKKKDEDCLKPYGVRLYDDPWKEKDCLTNLLNSLNFRSYTRVLESREEAVGSNFYIRQEITVNTALLLEDLEAVNFSLKPISLNFSVINMDQIRRMKFEQAMLAQSRYIGSTGFPTYNIYASQETFAEELDGMDFKGMSVFIEETGEGVIEVEFWR